MPIFNQPGSPGGGSLPLTGGTLTGPLGIDPTTYSPLGAALQIIAKGATGANLVQIQSAVGDDVFDIDDVGTVDITTPTHLQITALGHGELFRVNFGAGGAGAVGFFGVTPAAQPVVPLTAPTVQNVIDALVALGLVAQHD